MRSDAVAAADVDGRAAHLADCVEVVLIGTAVGDGVGLPYEGLSPGRARRMFGGPPFRHRLFFGWGTVSDDTDHTWMTAEALVASGGEPEAFARSLAWRLRFWLLSLPAGTGMATARAIAKLWVGFPPLRSGVWSAGNGPAMRSAILGVFAGDDPDRLRALVRASSRLTHTDPAAEEGAMAVALAAAYAAGAGGASVDLDAALDLFRRHLGGTQILPLLEGAVAAVRAGISPQDFLRECGLERGVTGYVNHTVPVAVFCWLRSPGDVRAAVEEVILAGGDTDSTAAIVGALAALSAGRESIPADWVDRLVLWPRSHRQVRALAERIANPAVPSPAFGGLVITWLAMVPRNLAFLLVVLFHGFRRLLPPY